MGFITKINNQIKSINYRQDSKKEAPSISKELFLRTAPIQEKIVSLKNCFQREESNEKMFSVFRKTVFPASNKKLFVSIEEGVHRKNLIASLPPQFSLDPEDKEELFEIARLFEEHKIKEAVCRFNQLPDGQKREIRGHLRKLGSDPSQLVTNLFKTKQALFATAFENTEKYFTVRKMNRWFADLNQCLSEESQKTKRVWLRP